MYNLILSLAHTVLKDIFGAIVSVSRRKILFLSVSLSNKNQTDKKKVKLWILCLAFCPDKKRMPMWWRETEGDRWHIRFIRLKVASWEKGDKWLPDLAPASWSWP